MPSSAATAPARRVGPCTQLASSCTTPSSLGNPPYPTDSSEGSSSWIFTPSTPASSVSVPLVINSTASFTPRMPFAEETAASLATRLRRTHGAAGSEEPATVSAAVPRKLRRVTGGASDTRHAPFEACGTLESAPGPHSCQLAGGGGQLYLRGVPVPPETPP